jgi:cytochrome c-type biogenesis protein CcmH/NrfG
VTASTILSILSVVLAVARFLIGYSEKNKWIAVGAAEAALKGLQDADAAIAAANQARANVRDTLTRNPDSLRDDDGFKRPD